MRTPIPPFAIFLAFVLGIVYAIFFAMVGSASELLFYVTMGLVLFWYGFLYFVVKVVVAALMGFQARWSALQSLVVGLPLALLYAAISAFGIPVDDQRVLVPWVAMRGAHRISETFGVGESMAEALLVWGAFFLMGIFMQMKDDRAEKDKRKAARMVKGGIPVPAGRRKQRDRSGFPETVPIPFDDSKWRLAGDDSSSPAAGPASAPAFDVGPEVVLRNWARQVGSSFFLTLNRYDDYTGVSSRFEYWNFVVVSNLLVALLLFFRDSLSIFLLRLGMPALVYSGIPALLPFLVGILTWWPTLSVTIRRLHDTGRSGRQMLIGLIPVFGWAWLLYLLLLPSQRLPEA
jgi:uncharacterized membrane protein YhaH (DUF805 family)